LTPGDIPRRFKLFKQTCSLIFNGALSNKTEAQKARLLLLWAGNKELEIYSKAMWEDEADQFKVVLWSKKSPASFLQILKACLLDTLLAKS